MAIQGKKLSELTEQVSNIQGKERIYVSDGSGKPKFIETNQLAKPSDIPDVSGFITKQQADGYYQPKGSYATTTQLADKADKVSTENVSEDTKEIQPNRYYIFGEKVSLTITLAAGEEGKLAEYMFEFTSGTTPTTLNLPESVKWMGDNTIEASKTYQVSIVNNIAVLGGA
jgi:hypothetical protein